MKKRKFILIPIFAVFLGILVSIPSKAGIWEKHYWKGFLYIVDEYLKEGEKPEKTDIHNYFGKEEKITIPKKVNGIPVRSVIGLGKQPGIREVHIPNGIRINASALSQVPTLEKITINKNNQDYMVKNGLLLSKDGKTLVACPGGLESVKIPDSVIDIHNVAFEGSSIKEITLGKNISQIETGAFKNCKNLRKVHFQKGSYVESLNDVFSGCTSLESITLPEGLKEITFTDCASLKSIILPDSVEFCSFFSCKNLERVVAGKNLKRMANFFNTPKLREVFIYSKDCKVMDGNIWGQESYMIDEESKCMDQVTVYGVEGSQTIAMAKKYGIMHEIIEEQEIGKERDQNWEYMLSTEHGKTSATIIGFYGKEKHLTVPSTIGEIPVSTLKSLGASSYVETVSIPDGIHVVGDALSSCKKLKTIQLSGKNSLYQVVNKMLLSKDGKTLISCPGNIKYPKIPSTVKKVADGAFSGSKIRKVTIGKNITDLGKCTFQDCKELSKVIFVQDSLLKNLKTNVFRNCTSLKKITLPESLQEIWYFVFAGCSSLETVTFGENLKFSGYNNFLNCEKLHSLYLPITEAIQTYTTELPYNLFYGMPERKSGRRKAVVYVKKDSPFHHQLKDSYSNVVQIKNDKK